MKFFAQAARRRGRGFTLIEVLIALVIVSLVLAAAMRAGGTMIVTQDALRRATLGGPCVRSCPKKAHGCRQRLGCGPHSQNSAHSWRGWRSK